MMVKPLLERVRFRDPHGRIDVMFGPVVTTEVHLAFCGAITHSINTAEMTVIIEALSFLGPRGPVARDEQSCICYDSQHAVGVSLSAIQVRTHAQGPSGNLGNECVDHATALGTFGRTSSHRVSKFITILKVPCVLVVATASTRSWTATH